jgi:Holliday junction resolvase RusA-like endonuclease
MAGRPPMSGPLRMSVLAVMGVAKSWPKKRKAAALAGKELPTKKPDASNILKLFEDGMNGIVFGDDAQIVEIRIRKVYGPVPQTVVVVVPDQGAAG